MCELHACASAPWSVDRQMTLPNLRDGNLIEGDCVPAARWIGRATTSGAFSRLVVSLEGGPAR
jgi:hypothetical protein